MVELLRMNKLELNPDKTDEMLLQKAEKGTVLPTFTGVQLNLALVKNL